MAERGEAAFVRSSCWTRAIVRRRAPSPRCCAANGSRPPIPGAAPASPWQPTASLGARPPRSGAIPDARLRRSAALRSLRLPCGPRQFKSSGPSRLATFNARQAEACTPARALSPTKNLSPQRAAASIISAGHPRALQCLCHVRSRIRIVDPITNRREPTSFGRVYIRSPACRTRLTQPGATFPLMHCGFIQRVRPALRWRRFFHAPAPTVLRGRFRLRELRVCRMMAPLSRPAALS